MTLITSVCVGAHASQTRVTRTLVDILARLAIGRQLIARVTDTFERSVHVETLAIVAHPRLTALVHVPTKSPVRRVNVAVLTNTNIRPRSVLTLTLETYPRILQTLVNIHTGQS